MNPSTAQILEAVEAAPADQVVILPNNKNIIPVAEQVDALTTKTVRVVPTTGIAEGFAALLEYDPEADGRRERRRDDGGGRQRRRRRGHPGRAGRRRATPAPSPRATTSASARDGIQAVAPALADAATALLDVLVTDDHEIVTLIEGEGANAADTRRITEWLDEHRPDVTVEVHHGGQPLYPYLFGIDRAAWPAAPPAGRDRGRPSCSGVGPKKRDALAEMEIDTVLDLLTHYPRRYIDRTQQADRRAGRRRGGHGAGHGQAGPEPAPAGGRSLVEVDVTDGSRLPALHVLQPAVAGQAAEGGHRGRSSSASSTSTRAASQMTNPVVDLVGDRTGRIVPIYPQSEKAGLTTWELGGWVEEALRAGRRVRRPAARALARRARPRRPHLGLPADPRARVAGRRPGRPQAAGLRRAAAPPGHARHAQAGGRADAEGHPPRRRRRARRPFHEPPAVPAHRRPAAGHRRDRRRPGRPPPDAPAAAGRRGRRQDGRRRQRAARGGAGRLSRARSWRPPRCWPSSTTSACASCSATSPCPTSATTLFGDRPLRVELLTNRTTGKERQRCTPALRRRIVDILIGTHALLTERRRVPLARRRGHRRAAPLRRRAARRPAGQGPAAEPCPTCW